MRELMTLVNPSLWSEISGAAFLIGFSLLLCWVYWPARKSTYEDLARLPIDKD